MHSFLNGGVSALLLSAHACVSAQSPTEPAQQVVISASTTDLRARSTTTSIIVGRDDIVRHGDATLTDVLKRLPGITVDASPGRGPAIRMRGMASGYVSVQLNGQPAPTDFSLESLSPELIERIEIQRVATAETSSQAVAGTINVVLRRPGPAKAGTGTEIKVGTASVGGHAAPQLIAQHSGRSGALAYSLTATMRRNENPIKARISEQGPRPALLRHVDLLDRQVEDVLELAPLLTWQRNPADQLTLQGYLRKRHIDNSKREDEVTVLGQATPFPRALHLYETWPLNAWAELALARKLSAGARLAARLSGFYTRRNAYFEYLGTDMQDTLLETHRVASGPVERELSFTGSWRRPLWGSHALAAGWEMGRKQRSEYRREQQTGASGALLRQSDEHYRARVLRSAVFIQDEWDINSAWSAYLGLRREDLHTTGAGNADRPVDVRAGAWSPTFQALYKPVRPEHDSRPRDQFRFAANRSYKAPGIIELMPRRYTVDNNNGPTNPDQQGNPRLRPELAMAIDMAWERYIGRTGMISVSAFHKRIDDITLTRLEEIDGVWIETPDNRGKATVRGIEFEGKATRGALSARVNIARNWSRVDSVPGPDNRIDGQSPWSGNVGLDYAPSTGSVNAGGTYTYRGGASSRDSALLFSQRGARRQLDLYAIWKLDARSRLRLSASDLLHQDYRERLAYQGGWPLERTTSFRTNTTWRLVWEQSM